MPKNEAKLKGPTTREINALPISEEDKRMLRTAWFHIGGKRHCIFSPASEAQVEYPDFQPHRIVQTVATVRWPAIVNCHEVTITHHILDGHTAY